MIFRLGELFSGPGGLALGAKLASEQVGINNVEIVHEWATDYDESTCETIRRNIFPKKPNKVICSDIRELDYDRLSDIDALSFGFPCNDFSLVGEQKGIEGNYGPLYTYGVKAINKFNPKWFLAENVGGLRNSNDGIAFKMIIDELRDQKYRLTSHLYKFEEYGVPQSRHRIIIIGIREDLNLEFKVPAPTTPNNYKTAKEALENPPIDKNTKNNELTVQSKTVIERLKYIKPGQNAFNADLPNHLKLNVKGAKISQIYKRLDPNKPSYTVTGSGGGGTHVYHWCENRALTNRERARLQTFPDSYIFHGSKENVRKQIGMAVPVLGAKMIFEAIIKTFKGIKYDSIESNIRL
jgi:DNA (cytosine-5)-methyltransferase 1